MVCEQDQITREQLRRVERPALAERGLNETQIADLEARVELAREKAKAASFGTGDTLEQQRDKITKAVDAAVDEWHRDIHAELKHDADTIKHLARVREQTKVPS